MAEIMLVTMKNDNFYYSLLYPTGEELPAKDAVIKTRVAVQDNRYKYVSRTVVHVDEKKRIVWFKLNRKKRHKLSSAVWRNSQRGVTE